MARGRPWTRADLDGGSRYNISASAGVSIDDFVARVSVSYRDGYNVTYPAAPIAATVNGPFQGKVDPFIVTNVFARYQLNDTVRLSLNVDNVFDEDPPILRTTGNYGITNGQTLGRVVTLGVSAEF
jgi:outer membrane receptor protein involved in Fe transport